MVLRFVRAVFLRRVLLRQKKKATAYLKETVVHFISVSLELNLHTLSFLQYLLFTHIIFYVFYSRLCNLNNTGMESDEKSYVPESHYSRIMKKHALPQVDNTASSGTDTVSGSITSRGDTFDGEINDDALDDDVAVAAKEKCKIGDDLWEACSFHGKIVSWYNAKTDIRILGSAKPPPLNHVDVTEGAVMRKLNKNFALLGKYGNGIVPLRKMNKTEKNEFGDVLATKVSFLCVVSSLLCSIECNCCELTVHIFFLFLHSHS